jgi:nitrous oxidase accessory protein NosD
MRTDALTRILTSGRTRSSIPLSTLKLGPGIFDRFYDRGGAVVNVRHPDFGAAGDGVTDDTAAIQAAIDAAEAAGGGIVFFPAGDYSITGLTVDDNVRLTGTSDSVLVLTGATDAIHVTGSNVTIDHLALDLTGATADDAIYVETGQSRVYVGDLKITASAADATNRGRVRFTNTDDFSVTRCVLDGTGVQSIMCGTAATNGLISRNVIKNYRNGIYVAEDCDGLIISLNRFHTPAGSGILAGYDAILLQAASNVSVVGNVIKGSREHGIYVSGTGTKFSEDVTISGNTIADVDSNGVQILGPSTTVVCKNISVDGNTIRDAVGFGLYVGNIEDLTISSNAVRGCNRALGIRGGTTGALVQGNSFNRSDLQGILIRDTGGDIAHVSIFANDVLDNDQNDTGNDGIAVLPDQGNDITEIVIANNDCSDTQGIPTQNNGINLVAVSGGGTASNIFIGRNRTRNNTAGGVTIGTGYTNAVWMEETTTDLSINDIEAAVTREDDNECLRLEGYGYGPHFNMRRSAGSRGSLSAIASQALMGQWDLGGYDGTAWATGARIWVRSSQAWTGSAHGTEILIATTPTDSTTLTNRWRIIQDGSLWPVTDLDVDIGSSNYRVNNIYANSLLVSSLLEGAERTDPAAPAANKGRLYFRDNGSGKTQLVVRFNTGAIQVIATEP